MTSQFTAIEAWKLRVREAGRDELIVCGAILLVVLGQVALIYTKAINWDEFLHYGIVYDLPRGRVVWDFQTIYARLFGWVPGAGRDIVDEILTTRFVMLGFELLAMAMVVLLARRFADRTAAALSGLLYISGGYTFLHGFSFRPDPMVAGMLMSCLYLMAAGRLDPLRMIVVGVLVGFAGLANMKAIFYLPCFAGIALIQLAKDGTERSKTLLRLAAIPFVALVTFVGLHQLHKIGIATEQGTQRAITTRILSYVGGEESPRYQYSLAQAALAPLVTVGLLLLPFAWKGKSETMKFALVGLVLPLVTLLFYRNTFPYYFAFILPPICVAIAVSLSLLLKRYHVLTLVLVMLATPVVLWFKLDRDALGNQRFLLSEVHRLFPEPTGYLSYTGYVSDYPRVIPYLISGVGLKRYFAKGDPVIARAIERGEVGFVLADTNYISAALEGRMIPNSLMPADFRALATNFLHYRGPLWVYGKEVCASEDSQEVMLHRGGDYTVEGGNVVISKIAVLDGQTIRLDPGSYDIAITNGKCIKFWNLPHSPDASVEWPDGPYGDKF